MERPSDSEELPKIACNRVEERVRKERIGLLIELGIERARTCVICNYRAQPHMVTKILHGVKLVLPKEPQACDHKEQEDPKCYRRQRLRIRVVVGIGAINERLNRLSKRITIDPRFCNSGAQSIGKGVQVVGAKRHAADVLRSRTPSTSF